MPNGPALPRPPDLSISTNHTSAPKLDPNLLLGEFPRLAPQHFRHLLPTHPNLLSHRHQRIRQMQVVLPQQRESKHQIIDIVEHQRAAVSVGFLGLQEMDGLLAPVAEGVEVVRGVVAVVEAEAV